MPPTIPLRPYYAAAQMLTQLVRPGQTKITQIEVKEILEAAAGLRATVRALPGMSDNRLAELDKEIQELTRLDGEIRGLSNAAQGKFVPMVVNEFAGKLWNLGFLPPSEGEESEKQCYERLIGDYDPGDSMLAGSEGVLNQKGETRIGLGSEKALIAGGMAAGPSMRRTIKWTPLAPEHSPAVPPQPISVSFQLDGRLPRGSVPQLTLARFANRNGLLEFEAFGRTEEHVSQEAVELEHGSTYGVHFKATGVTPVFIPLPVRPGNYGIRIPVYHEHEVPKRYVVIPAGGVVHHDYAMGPLVTNLEYQKYLEKMPKEGGKWRKWIPEWILKKFFPSKASLRTPRNWKLVPSGNFRYKDNLEIPPKGPVTLIGYPDAFEYLEYLSEVLGMPVRLPFWSELIRATLGNDQRTWPWGDAAPGMGLAAFQYPTAPEGSSMLPSPIDDPDTRDISPFSEPGIPGIDDPQNRRVLTHLAGNLQKLVGIGTPRERALIAKKLGISPEDLTSGKYFVTAGACFNDPPPDNPEILKRNGHNDIIPAGIFPTIQLREADPKR